MRLKYSELSEALTVANHVDEVNGSLSQSIRGADDIDEAGSEVEVLWVACNGVD